MKKFLLALTMAVALSTTAAFALPGVTPYVADTSGEYVYYKDTSFKRTSYIGFLYYDEGTYAVRYYAPADAAQSLPVKDITLYLTVNKNSDHLELTGENISGVNGADDTDVVNYMHDLFYELTSRRQKVTVTGSSKSTVQADFAQFGGKVTMTYSTLVPIFNLFSINNVDGSVILQVQTTGLLTGSTDNGFTTFIGIDTLPKDKPRSFKKKLFAKKTSYTVDGQTVTIDNMWTQSTENMWLLGNNALLMLDTIPASTETAAENYYADLVRKSCESTQDSYAVWPQSTVAVNANTTHITNVFFQPQNGNISRDFIIITKKNNGTYAFFKLTVFESTYEKNKSYFDKIIQSLK